MDPSALVDGLTSQAKGLIKDGNPIQTLGNDCDKVSSGNQNLGRYFAPRAASMAGAHAFSARVTGLECVPTKHVCAVSSCCSLKQRSCRRRCKPLAQETPSTVTASSVCSHLLKTVNLTTGKSIIPGQSSR